MLVKRTDILRVRRVFTVFYAKKQPHFYIGETTSVSRRIASHKHKLRKLKHGNSSLQVDWQVLGESQFEFIILHCVDLNGKMRLFESITNND